MNTITTIQKDNFQTIDLVENYDLQAILDRFNISAFASMVEGNTSFNFAKEKATYFEDTKLGARISNKSGLYFFNNKNKVDLQNGGIVAVAKELLGYVGKMSKDEYKSLCDFLAKYAHIDRSVYVELKEYTPKAKISTSKSHKPKSSHSPKPAKIPKLDLYNKQLDPFITHHSNFENFNTLPDGSKAIDKNEWGKPVFRYGEIVIDENGNESFEPYKVDGTDIEFYRLRNYKHEIDNYGKYRSHKAQTLEPNVKAYILPFHQARSLGIFDNSPFETLIVPEGEKKAIAANLIGVPSIGSGGINSFTINRNSEGLTRKQYKAKYQTSQGYKTTDSSLLPETIRFIEKEGVKNLVYAVDNDFIDNFGNENRAKAFISFIWWLTFAVKKLGNVNLWIVYPNFDQAKGLDDVIYANFDQKEVIKNELKAEIENGFYSEGQFITKRLIHDVNEPNQTKFRLKNIIALVKKSVDGVRFDRFLTEGGTREKVLKDFDSDIDISMPPPTGSGKTEITAVYKDLKNKSGFEGNLFDCSPTNMGTTAKTNEYGNKDKNYSGLKLKAFQYDQTADPKEKEMYGHDIKPFVDVTNTCFPSQAALVMKGEVKEKDIVFIDEAHKLMTNFNIIGSSTVNAIMNAKGRKILTTATHFPFFNRMYGITPKPYFRLKNTTVNLTGIRLGSEAKMLKKYGRLTNKLKEVKTGIEKKTGKQLENAIKRKGKIEKQIEELTKGQTLSNSECSSLFLTAAKVQIDATDSQDGKIHFMFINNKDHIAELEKYAASKVFDTDKVWGGDDSIKQTETWKTITKANDAKSEVIEIREGFKSKFVFFTSVGYELINILNENIGKVSIFGESWVENVIQAVGRFRRMKELEVLYFRGADYGKKGFYQDDKEHEKEWKDSYNKAKEIIEGYNKMFLFSMSENDRKQYHRRISTKIKNDVSAIICNDGSFNKAGCVYAYENKKQMLETNQQKFERLADSFFVESKDLDITQLGVYLKANTNIEKIQIDVENYQQDRKEKKETAAEMCNELFKENAIFSLMLAAENTKSPIRKKEISDLVGIDTIKESSFANWKDEKRMKNIELSDFSRVEKQQLGRCASQVLSVASKIENVSESNIKSIGEHVGNKDGKLLDIQIDMVQLLDVPKGLLKNRKDWLNKCVYESVIEKLEVGVKYSNGELKEAVSEVYSEFKHRGFKSPLSLIRCLFETENKRVTIEGKQFEGKLLKRRIDKHYIQEKYGVLIGLKALNQESVYDLAVKSFKEKEFYSYDSVVDIIEKSVGGHDGSDGMQKMIVDVLGRLLAENFEEITIQGKPRYEFLKTA